MVVLPKVVLEDEEEIQVEVIPEVLVAEEVLQEEVLEDVSQEGAFQVQEEEKMTL